MGAHPAITPWRHGVVACPDWIYNNRRHVERLWGRLKEWQLAATRYWKTAFSFMGVLNLAASVDWFKQKRALAGLTLSHLQIIPKISHRVETYMKNIQSASVNQLLVDQLEDKIPTKIVIVLGMHRSGTSLCSNILSVLGIDMVDDIGVGNANQKGHWERLELLQFHDRIFHLFNRSYYSEFHDFQLPSGWWATPEVRKIRLEIENFLKTKIRAGEIFGFKDPRTARLLPMWKEIFRSLNISPYYIYCVRSPSQVARSLYERDKLPIEVGEYRWLTYNVECLKNTSERICVVDYESWFSDADGMLAKISVFLHELSLTNQFEVSQVIEDIVSRDLRHTSNFVPDAKHPAIRNFYNIIKSYNENEDSSYRIKLFVNQFIAFQQIQPFELLLNNSLKNLSLKSSEIEILQNQLTAQRDEALRMQDQLTAERDEALRMQDQLTAERDEALRMQDQLSAERDEALRMQNQLIVEQNTLSSGLGEIDISHEAVQSSRQRSDG